MIIKLIIIALLILGLFTVSLIVSYEGFQISPNLRTQQMSFDDVLSMCNAMNSILASNGVSFEQTIRLLNNNEIFSQFNLQEIDIIEQCLQGKLPELSSSLIPQKIGFLEGLNGHEAKGQAKVIVIKKSNYLRLDSFEIGYEPKVGETFEIPELHVYLSQGNPISPEIYLDKLKTKLGSKNYKLPDVDLDNYDTTNF